jgi:hypothetical protein
MMLQDDAEEVALSCVDAIKREDFEAARRLVSDDMSFLASSGRGREATSISRT